MWVRDIFANCHVTGEYHCLLQELRLKDAQSHWCYLSIYLSKRSYNSVVKAEISVAERLALTI